MTSTELTLFCVYRWLQVSGFYNRAACRRWNERHPEKRKEATRIWDGKNRKAWIIRNLDAVRIRRRTYEKNRLADTGNALRKRISNRLRDAVRGRGSKKGAILGLLGCSIEQLKTHLEKQFLPGMSWENRNLWHIDHKKPCASFDLTRVEEQKKCFHFSNLQPLWAIDNLKKGDSDDVTPVH
jgi:hypothetical protein